MSQPQSFWARRGGAIITALLLGLVAYGLFSRGGGGSASPLLGKPAPAFELASLSGGTVNLNSHAGKDVVVLDFFATWCPPCRESLPHLAQLAKDYAGKGVAVYAVNCAEDKATVEGYFKENGLSLNVLMDEGMVSDAYGVTGIPQQVIIGKDGLVQYVNAGFGYGVEAEIRAGVDSLLAGKPLVPVEPAKP